MGPHVRMLAAAWLAQQAVAAQAAACCACNMPTEEKGWLKKADDAGGCQSYKGYFARQLKKNFVQTNTTEERTCTATEWVDEESTCEDELFQKQARAYAEACLVDLDGEESIDKALLLFNVEAGDFFRDLYNNPRTGTFQELKTVQEYRSETLKHLTEQLEKALPPGASGIDLAVEWTKEKEQEVKKKCNVVHCPMVKKEEAAAAEALKKCTEAEKVQEVHKRLEKMSTELQRGQKQLDACVGTYTYMELAEVVLRVRHEEGAGEANARAKLLAETILRAKEEGRGISVDEEEDMVTAAKAAMRKLCGEGKLNWCSRLGQPMSYPAEEDSEELKVYVQKALKEWQSELAKMPVKDLVDRLVKGSKNQDSLDCDADTIGRLYDIMAESELVSVRNEATQGLMSKFRPKLNIDECKGSFVSGAGGAEFHDEQANKAKDKRDKASGFYAKEEAEEALFKAQYTAERLRKRGEAFCTEDEFTKVCNAAAGASEIQKKAGEVWKPPDEMEEEVKKDLKKMFEDLTKKFEVVVTDEWRKKINEQKAEARKEWEWAWRKRRTTAAGHQNHRFLRMLRRAFQAAHRWGGVSGIEKEGPLKG